MAIILLGSHAWKQIDPNILPGLDLDILGSYDEIVKYMKSYGKIISMYPFNEGKKLVAKYDDGQIIEAEINWGHGSTNMLYNLVVNYGMISKSGFLVPDLDLLYTIKMSHRFLKNSPHFNKTMIHIHKMRSQGTTIRPEYQEFLKLREKETYNYSHPKLNQTKKDFFSDDGIEYRFDHDSIHESIKLFDKPAYKYYSPEEVKSSKKMFMACEEGIKLAGVLEEALVLALERSQIPFENPPEAYRSFEIALMKVCTSITSGWFREYAWENYYKVVDMYWVLKRDYVTKFWQDVENGLVKEYSFV